MPSTFEKLSFSVLPVGKRVPPTARSKGYLIRDNWDDWGTYSTQFWLVLVDEGGTSHNIGSVKIGQFKMKAPQRRPELPDSFDHLDDRFFSLGQDASYYEAVSKLSEGTRAELMSALRDVAADPVLWAQIQSEDVTRTSLLRYVNPKTVRGQFHRLAHGGAKLTSYSFSYAAPKRLGGGAGAPPVLTFEVQPESYPPTNIHVLIGRNGVGKTRLLSLMTRALVADPSRARRSGLFTSGAADPDAELFANLVSVTFSAFDPFDLLPSQDETAGSTQHAYIGLRRTSKTGKGIGTPKSQEMLAGEFVESAKSCRRGLRSARWLRALSTLRADPMFSETEVTGLADIGDDTEFELAASTVFSKLSSGHKIVLLTLTRLVESVDEKTLVLLDEPEAHLHPPLLAAFVRALSDLLVNRNGVAIIATHSPVVVQEVPRTCVWKLRRTGHVVSVERPEIETFGENVGVLTREVFGLEVTQSGFHTLLRDAVDREPDFKAVLRRFDNELGAEAQAIVRGLVASKSLGA